MSDPREKQLSQALADCVLDSSWFFCVAGVALAIPLGIRQKVGLHCARLQALQLQLTAPPQQWRSCPGSLKPQACADPKFLPLQSYMPVVYLGLAGTLVDLMNGAWKQQAMTSWLDVLAMPPTLPCFFPQSSPYLHVTCAGCCRLRQMQGATASVGQVSAQHRGIWAAAHQREHRAAARRRRKRLKLLRMPRSQLLSGFHRY
jgi:hypothetical protein